MRAKKSFLTIGLALSLATLLLQPQASFARKKEVIPSDKQEAITWVEQGLAWGHKNIKVSDQYVLWTSEDGKYNFGIALARLAWIRFSNETENRYVMARVTWQDYAHDNPEYVQRPYYRGGETKDEKLKAAMEFLAADARQQVKAQLDSQFDGFKAQAKAWREASVKPAMPEAAREHQVLAEYAFKEKRYGQGNQGIFVRSRYFPDVAGRTIQSGYPGGRKEILRDRHIPHEGIFGVGPRIA